MAPTGKKFFAKNLHRADMGRGRVPWINPLQG